MMTNSRLDIVYLNLNVVAGTSENIVVVVLSSSTPTKPKRVKTKKMKKQDDSHDKNIANFTCSSVVSFICVAVYHIELM